MWLAMASTASKTLQSCTWHTCPMLGWCIDLENQTNTLSELLEGLMYSFCHHIFVSGCWLELLPGDCLVEMNVPS